MAVRIKLKELNGERIRFRGIFLKFGIKTGFKGRLCQTVLLVDIVNLRNGNQIITDHLWFNYTKELQNCLPLLPGDILEFNGRVRTYQKGYREDDEENPIRMDYNLQHPRKIEKMGISQKYAQENQNLIPYNAEIMIKVDEHNQHRQERIQEFYNNQANQDEENCLQCHFCQEKKGDYYCLFKHCLMGKKPYYSNIIPKSAKIVQGLRMCQFTRKQSEAKRGTLDVFLK